MLAGLLVLLLAGGGEGTVVNGDFEGKAEKGGRPPGWVFELGAQNGATTPESRVELDGKVKHGGKAALCFSGDASTRGWLIAKQALEVRPGGEYRLEAWTRTSGVEGNGFGLDNCYVGLRWTHLVREFPAEPGDLWRWSGKLRAADVRQEGPQFANLHMNLAFVDGKGQPLGEARFGALEPGTHDWTDVATEGVAPEGTKKILAGLFLSMSGTAWFDQLALTVEKGLPVPYGDWLTLEGKGVVLRHAPDHPHANEMKAHLAALEQSKRTTCRRLEVEFPEKITVLLYKDLDEGRRLTGATLDFADPENRRVHQLWDSYIGHEMVHVIAHNTLQYGPTGILGEGIAVWLNGQFRDHHADARKLLDEGKLPSVADLLTRFREVEASYPAAGSFCGFLIEQYGLEVFKQLYPLSEPSPRLKELEGKSFEELEPAWHAHIRKS